MPIQVVIQTRDNTRGAYTSAEVTTSDPAIIAAAFELSRAITDEAQTGAGTPAEDAG